MVCIAHSISFCLVSLTLWSLKKVVVKSDCRKFVIFNISRNTWDQIISSLAPMVMVTFHTIPYEQAPFGIKMRGHHSNMFILPESQEWCYYGWPLPFNKYAMTTAWKCIYCSCNVLTLCVCVYFKNRLSHLYILFSVTNNKFCYRKWQKITPLPPKR